jgi:transposase-like protein
MSWREGFVSEQELHRQAKHRLAVIRHAHEVSGNVAQTCRYYGISRQTYYSWFRRYEEFGLDGLRDRSKRPHVSPWATPSEVVAKIIYLRSTTTSGLTRSRCISSATTTSRFRGRGPGASSSAST